MLEDLFDDYVEEKEEVIEDKPVKKKNYMFEIMDSINYSKKKDLLKNAEYESAFSPWVVMRWLSMDESLTELIGFINPYVGVLSKKQIYQLLLEAVPKKKRFIKYIKPDAEIQDDDVELVSKYYEVSLREAREYIELMGSEWTENISKSYGGADK